MSYQHMGLEAKTLAGFSARTSNHDPEMGKIIGEIWQRLFQAVPDAAAGETYGVYSDYENGTEGRYTVTAAVPASEGRALPPGAGVLNLPAGSYAVFSAPGGPEAAAALWQEIWAAPLNRAFTYDFERYSAGPDGPQLQIYIALRV